MRWRALVGVVLVVTACGRFGSEGEEEGTVGVGGDINVPTVQPERTVNRPSDQGSAVPSAVATTTTLGPVVEVEPPPTIAGSADPCAGRSTRSGPDNVAERTDGHGLLIRITLAPTVCLKSTDDITVAVDVANGGTDSWYFSSRRPVAVGFIDDQQRTIWSSCTVGRSVPGAPPDVPIEIPPGRQERLGTITYSPKDARCGSVPAGTHTAAATVQSCTSQDAADRACDESALVPIPSAGLRFAVR